MLILSANSSQIYFMAGRIAAPSLILGYCLCRILKHVGFLWGLYLPPAS